MNHGYSIEHLYHYTCGACGKWWSIGDSDIKDGAVITCPRCKVTAPTAELPSFCAPGFDKETGTTAPGGNIED